LLAAGSSTRLGKPKQLLQYNSKSLLNHTTDVVVATGIQPFIIVLGANADLLIPEIDNNKALIVVNKNWKGGMATSIISGLTALLENQPATDNVIFLMCDQPFVTTSLLNNLVIIQQETGKPIVASNYDDILGVPALFNKTFFSTLMQLQGDTGARKVIQQHINEVATVPFLKGKIDIDTAEDYENLLQNNNE
jgi:molybdenum cofactor cytidylyltransferase